MKNLVVYNLILTLALLHPVFSQEKADKDAPTKPDPVKIESVDKFNDDLYAFQTNLYKATKKLKTANDSLISLLTNPSLYIKRG
jgi:hypothetical protein